MEKGKGMEFGGSLLLTNKVICIHRESLSMYRIFSAHHLIAEMTNRQFFVHFGAIAAQVAHQCKEVKKPGN